MRNITIIMRSHNDAAIINDTLKMVYAQTVKGFELINLDNSSSDGTLEIIKQYNKSGKVLNIEEGKYIPGKALNQAVAMAQGEFVVFLNSDATPADEKWLENLIDRLKWEENIVAVYGRQIARKDAGLLTRMDYERAYPAEGAQGMMSEPIFSFASAALYKKIWEKFKFYEGGLSEDIEWYCRVVKDGYSCRYIPRSIVYHSHNYKIKKLFIKTYQENIPLGPIYRGRVNFLVLLKRCLAAIARDLAGCIKEKEFRSFFYSPIYRLTLFISSYLGMRRGIKSYGK